VELGAVGVEQGTGERLEDVGDVGEEARRLALRAISADYGSRRGHDTFRFVWLLLLAFGL
jgi:hypothetical protein